MSRGALKELIRASLPKFKKMLKDVPSSEKNFILDILVVRAQILENL